MLETEIWGQDSFCGPHWHPNHGHYLFWKFLFTASIWISEQEREVKNKDKNKVKNKIKNKDNKNTQIPIMEWIFFDFKMN